MRSTLTIATRQSELALWQANFVRDQLLRAHAELTVRLRKIETDGDKHIDAPLADIGGKGLFLKELEAALLSGEADLAVHSVKDMTAQSPDGLTLAAICARADARDAFVSNRVDALHRLPPDFVVGTCSLRRQCQLRARFANVRVVNLRGNVPTRLAKLDNGELDGVVLAVAGLERLNLHHRIGERLDVHHHPPAAGQGAIGVQCRVDDHALRAQLARLNCADSALCVRTERHVAANLGGDCHAPIAVHATQHDAQLHLRAMVGAVDGSTLLRADHSGASQDADALAAAVAEDLLAQGAAQLLDEARRA